MKVVIQPSALDDLVDIGTYIARDNPARAETFVAELERRCRSLGDSPEAYPLVPRHRESGVRRCSFRDYLIFYVIVAETVEIIHVLHGARDIDAILFPED